MNDLSNNATRFTAWCAIAGGILAYLNVALVVAATNGDTQVIFNAATMLSLPHGKRELFRLGMAADVIGFYLPVLVIGGYLWARFRAAAGVMGDVALLAIVVYTVAGIAGATLQMAALQPLSLLHAAGDASVRAGAEGAWTAIAQGCQKGLWWSEGPVVLLWGTVVGPHLARAGVPKFMRILLTATGWCFGAFFLVGLVPGLEQVSDLLLVIVVLIFPFWMISFGGQLLRQ